MPIISLPYEYKNGVAESGTITIDTTLYPLCGNKYYELRPLKALSLDTSTCIYYNYRGDEYGTSTLSIDDFYTAINEAFACADDCNCNQQSAMFSYEIEAIRKVNWSSDKILKAVGSGDFIYQLSLIKVNGITYATTTIWDDSTDPTVASETAYDYVQAVIDYIESLSIPEYAGANNKAINGVDDNNLGDGLLNLYFNALATVEIEFTIGGVLTGSMIEIGTETIALTLEMTDTSTVNPSDVITETLWQVSDGEKNIFYNVGSPAYLSVWNIQGCNSMSTVNNWVLTLAIETQNECYVNNVSSTIVLASDIQNLLNTGVAITGNGH